MSAPDSSPRILTITSAPGWAALFEQPDDPLGEHRAVTLAAWALVDDGTNRPRLVGLVQKSAGDDTPAGSFAFADETEGFTGYSNRGLLTRPPE